MAPPVCITGATHAGPGGPLRVSHRRVAAGKQGHYATDAGLDAPPPALPVTVKVTWAPSTESPQRSAHDGGEDSVPLPAVGTPPHPGPGASPAGALKRNHVTDRSAPVPRSEEQATQAGDVAMAAAPQGCGTPEAKRPRASAISAAAASDNAVALGYELGTIKHSAFVLLHAAGPAGLTVSIIVETASKAGMYCWGTCKTPNNSVTAALSQDPNFQRVAPSTYALRDVLKPVGQAALREAQAAKAAAAALENAARKDQVGGGTSGAGLPPQAPSAKPKALHKAPRPKAKATASGSRSSDGGAQNQQQHQAGKHSTHGENHHAVARAPSGAAAQQAPLAAAVATQRWGPDAADHVMPSFLGRCGTEDDPFAVMPEASSASLYPPPSPEEAGGEAPGDECTSPDAVQLKGAAPRRGGQSSGKGSRLQARYTASEPAAAAAAAAASSEAQARADRWRAEASALWLSSLSRGGGAKGPSGGATCGDGLPKWVVASYLADKARRASGDSCGDDAYATPTPPQVSPMALRPAA